MGKLEKAVPEKDREDLYYILNSDVAKNSMESGVQQELISEMNKYKQYRNNYAKNIVFDPAEANLSKYV